MSTTFSKIKERRDTAANWTSANPVLSSGEIGYEIDGNKFKIGNGSTPWNSLSAYFISLTGTDTGALPYVDTTGNLVSDGDVILYDAVNHNIKILDEDLVPSISLGVTAKYTVGIASQASSGHYIGEAHEFNIVQSGDAKVVLGEFHRLGISGTYTNCNAVGVQYVFDNRTSFQSGTGYVLGMSIFMNCESATHDVYGLTVDAGAGGSGASPIANLVGIWGVAVGGHNGHQDLATGIIAEFDNVDGGFGIGVQTVDLAKSLQVMAKFRENNLVTEFRGVSISDWTIGGTSEITTSYGIYIDNTIDIGDTRWAIFSTSISPSKISGGLTIANTVPSPQKPINSLSTRTSTFNGAVEVPNSTFGDTWGDNATAPTRNDIYNFTRLNSSAAAALDYRHRVIHFHDGEDITGTPNGGFTVNQSQAGTWNGTLANYTTFSDSVGVLVLTMRTTGTPWGASISERGLINSTKSEFGVFTHGIVKAKFRIAFTTLSNGTDSYTCYVGLHNGCTNTVLTVGAFFRYTHSVNGGKWEAVCKTGGIETAVDTGITPVADSVMHTFRTETDTNGTLVNFFIDDVLITTISTNVPVSTDVLGASYQVIRNAGTTDNINIMAYDYARSEWQIGSSTSGRP